MWSRWLYRVLLFCCLAFIWSVSSELVSDGRDDSNGHLLHIFRRHSDDCGRRAREYTDARGIHCWGHHVVFGYRFDFHLYFADFDGVRRLKLSTDSEFENRFNKGSNIENKIIATICHLWLRRPTVFFFQIWEFELWMHNDCNKFEP